MGAELDIILMHKEVQVAKFSIDAELGYISSRIEIFNEEHLPLPVKFAARNDFAMVNAMQSWVAYRSIPKSRLDFADFLAKYGVKTPSAAAYKSLGLNLSDQYWYKPDDLDVKWSEVNLFENSFLKQGFQSNNTLNGSIISPDSNSNGELPKFWCIEDGRRLLYKQGSGTLLQQPYNELFADKLLDRLQIPHVEYSLANINDRPYSVCETFVDKNTEYIPAIDILQAVKQSNNENSYQNFWRCVAALYIDVEETLLNNMLVFDRVINNIDRHYGNFGFIREADSLEFKGFSPIFDNGNSLWYNVADFEMITRNQPAKPFKPTQEKQLKLIKTADMPLSLFTPEFVEKTAYDVYLPAVRSGRISEMRIENIVRNVNYTVQSLRRSYDGNG